MFLHKRLTCFLVLAFVILVPYFVSVLFSPPNPQNLSLEQELMSRVIELQVQLHHLEAQSKSFKPYVREMPKNINSMRIPPTPIRLPSAYNFFPHLLDDPDSLRPAYLLSKGRANVSIVLGLPTVKRDKKNYFMDTLQNLLDAISFKEAQDTIIVVFIAETDIEYVLQVAKEIELRYAPHIDSGLIEIISPSASYYPDFNKLRITRGDSQERLKWRSKQNLDLAYLMSYAHHKGTYYVQLEDDIIAKKNFISIMKQLAIMKSDEKMQWFVLDFCQLGFIGKLFKSVELPRLIQFFQMFFNDTPADWLLHYYWLTTREKYNQLVPDDEL